MSSPALRSWERVSRSFVKTARKSEDGGEREEDARRSLDRRLEIAWISGGLFDLTDERRVSFWRDLGLEDEEGEEWMMPRSLGVG